MTDSNMCRWAEGTGRQVYCTLCMQKRVGVHGDRDEPEGVESDEVMKSK